MHDIFTETDKFFLINSHVTVVDCNQYWTWCFRTVCYLKSNKNLINLKLQGLGKLPELMHFKVVNIFVQGTVGNQAVEGKQLLPIKHDLE